MMKPVPKLGQTVKCLTRIRCENQSAKELAQVYAAAVAFLCHLKADQGTLHKYGQAGTYPAPDDIPAITAVIQDAGLFRVLIKCLQVPADPEGERHTIGRKRSLSLVSEPVGNKSLKASHSPVPGTRPKLVINVQDAQTKPSFNVAVVAASILYGAFQHVDHWPTPLVRAYAEDCFGPRLWVDDEGCRLLVKNLALSHEEIVSAVASEQLNEEAKLVAEAYGRFELTEEPETSDLYLPEPEPPSPVKRRGSLSSSGSLSTSRPSIMRRESGSRSHLSSMEELSDDGDKDDFRILNGDGVKSDSSSGEEDADIEEVLVTTGDTMSASVALMTKQSTDSTSENKSTTRLDLYPIQQVRVNLCRVRQRFFGRNLGQAHEAISSALVERLDLKSKQNSGLLQCLPMFTTIPGVRSIVADNLEKWLQSPALAGLARTLFSSTVGRMKNLDPPLEDDLRAVDRILSMRLKANQLNAHIDNITVIAKGIPTAVVAHRIYATLLSDISTPSDPSDNAVSDKMKMVVAVHKVLPSHISYDALAATLLSMLVQNVENGDPVRHAAVDRHTRVRKLMAFIRLLAVELGSEFDGCGLMDALLSFDVSGGRWTTRDEEDKARLMFQCVTSQASQLSSESADGWKAKATGLGSTHAHERLRNSVMIARKALLSWCCNDYGPRWPSGRSKQGKLPGEFDVGPGPPEFSSALARSHGEEKIPAWLNVMRCLLFLEEADSALMRAFVQPGASSANDDVEWEGERRRIGTCCNVGGGVDDEMLWIVIRACDSLTTTQQNPLPSTVAIRLLENMVESCSKNRNSSIEVHDPNIVWELYNLVEYSPDDILMSSDSASDDGDQDKNSSFDSKEEQLPRLAYPGLWWRVTLMALVLSGASTAKIGAVVWVEHPTLRALVKMIVSNRYRFPTVDCDDTMREEIKKAEQAARDMETNIAERLFLPRRKRVGDGNDKKAGSRVSKRILKQLQEKQLARELAETARRKKLLKSAQKSIMLWDPDGPARKPPREVADLLLSTESRYGLAETFQQSLDPDFLLLTLGGTSRDAIERAYDWLIPVISKYPGTISRLPSTASCVLLLRAYGTEGDERTQLKELSSPLLSHIAGCLKGDYGEVDSVKAFDLLMSDVASRTGERRRCGRRVLADAMLQLDSTSEKSWTVKILEVKYATQLVPDAIKHMSIASSVERGRVLRSLIMALDAHIAFAECKSIESGVKFPELIVELVSSRPTVLAEAIVAFSDLRALVVAVIRSEFDRWVAADIAKTSDDTLRSYAKLRLRNPGNVKEVSLPLSLLQSIAVILSTFRVGGSSNLDVELSVSYLMDLLIRNDVTEGDDEIGLASAVLAESDRRAVSVESWILLAKAASDEVARRAALSAPTCFLARLLLCTGLPKASLVTMLDRLGRLGESNPSKQKLYEELLVSSASNEWDIGRVGQRRELARKLLGRISAYVRLYSLNVCDAASHVSNSFLSWLDEECRAKFEKKPKHQKSKKGIKTKASQLVPTDLLSRFLSVDAQCPGPVVEMEDNVAVFLPMPSDVVVDPSDLSISVDSVERFLQEEEDYDRLDEWLHAYYAESFFNASEESSSSQVALRLLIWFEGAIHSDERRESAILKWLPLLSGRSADPDPPLWTKLFSSDKDSARAVVMKDLIGKCGQFWDGAHVAACVEWISSANTKEILNFCAAKMARFLVVAGGAVGQSLSDESTATFPGLSDSATRVFVSVAIRSIQDESEGEYYGQTLLLMTAGWDKDSTRRAAGLLLQERECSTTRERLSLDAAIFRLYVARPLWLNLGLASVRLALINAAVQSHQVWTTWPCQLDNQMQNLLYGIAHGETRLAKSLVELSRSHPLLIFRQIGAFIEILDYDATEKGLQRGDNRIIHGESIYGSAEASMYGHLVRVTVRHWGYSYSESLWYALLEVVRSLPNEVLFDCGLKLGLLEFLAVYLKLVSVQSTLRSADRLVRLKSKLAELFTAFQGSSLRAWRNWLGRFIDGQEVRHVLMSCDFITPQEAIESLKPVTAEVLCIASTTESSS